MGDCILYKCEFDHVGRSKQHTTEHGIIRFIVAESIADAANKVDEPYRANVTINEINDNVELTDNVT